MKKGTLENLMEFLTAAFEEPETETVGQLQPDELAQVNYTYARIEAEKNRIEKMLTDEAERLRQEMRERLEKFMEETAAAEEERAKPLFVAASTELENILSKYTDEPDGVQINRETGELTREVGGSDE